MMNSKKGNASIIIIALIVLFVFAFIFSLFYPVFNRIDDKVSPELSGNWLTAFNNQRTMIVAAPVVGFLLVIVFIIVKFFQRKDEGPYYG